MGQYSCFDFLKILKIFLLVLSCLRYEQFKISIFLAFFSTNINTNLFVVPKSVKI